MNRGWVLLVLASSFPAAPAIQAQLAYQPRIRVPDQGESFQVKLIDTTKTTTTKVVEGVGQVLAYRKKVAKAKSFVYRAAILAKAADALHPASSMRAYEKAELTDDGVTRVFPLQGKTVLLERKGDKFEHRFENGTKLNADLLETLDDLPANSLHAQAFMPRGAVIWPDGNWPLDPNLLARTLPADLAEVLDAAEGRAGARLKTGRHEGKKFYGTIEVKIEIPLKPGANLNGVKIRTGKVAFTATIDGRIDGDSVDRMQQGKLEMNLQGSQEADGKTFAVWVEMLRTTVESYAEIQKK